jgi:prepilin-type N-terminal cleavage/methylation domain-containing protein
MTQMRRVAFMNRDVRSDRLAGTSVRPVRRGFTLIELVVAMAILLVVMIGVLSAVSYAYINANDTEMRNTAKNIGAYTLEYLRARTVTRGTGTPTGLMTALTMTTASTGNYGWYTASNTNGFFPSMIDAENLPLQSNGKPCNFLWAYVKSAPKFDGNINLGSGAGIAAGGQAFKFSAMNPALPTDKYATTPLAWTTTLQGYVSVRNRLLTNDVSNLTTTQNPAPEDKNLARMLNTTANNANGRYRTTLTNFWTGLIVQYPGLYPSTQPLITSFTAGSTYLAKVYTTDPLNVDNTRQQYNPYYTNVAGDKAATQDYRGLRVLTQAIARTADAAYHHVQYYDVSIMVLWMNGTHESNYELVSQIIAY